MAFFDAVTGVSGKLYPVAKENRRAKAAEYLAVGPFAHHQILISSAGNLCGDSGFVGHACCDGAYNLTTGVHEQEWLGMKTGRCTARWRQLKLALRSRIIAILREKVL